MKEILKLKELENHELPFFRYIAEDKSKYITAKSKGYVDIDDDFLIGESGGFLLNINFIFVNTHKFNEVGRFYDEHKYYYDRVQLEKYFNNEEVEPGFKQFWAREAYRRRHGMTANCKLYFKDMAEYFDPNTSEERKQELLHPLRITGDHYNFLNYGRIYRALTDEEIAKYPKGAKIPKKKYGFPGFIDGQYWNYKIDEFIYNNNYNLTKSKARRKGYSYMRGSQGANTVNSNKNVTIVLAAYELTYLTDPGATSDMVKTNLDWYENQTAWRRGYISEDLTALQLGYKKQKTGNIKYGYKSKVLSEACRTNTSAVVGKDAFEIDFEEAGVFPNLAEVMDVTTSTTEDGDRSTGTIRIYGTGGTKNANWEAFQSYFYNPSMFEMMPFENVFDDDMRHTTCGFFHGQYWGYGTFMEDGNSLLIEAYNHDAKRKEEYARNNTEAKTTIFKAQRANKPSEAFLNTRDNLFASQALNDWILRLQHDPEVKIWNDGWVEETAEGVVFKTNKQLKSEGKTVHPHIEKYPIDRATDIRGCLRMFHPPYKEGGEVPKDTYFITYDPVGLDIDKQNLTIRHSLNSIKVWMYPNNDTPFNGKRLVATWAGRHDSLLETDKFILNVSKLYNAKILAEIDRGDIVKNFKRWNELNRLIKDPTSIITKGKYAHNASYGMKIGNVYNKAEGLRKVRELIYEIKGFDDEGKLIYFLHHIYDIPFLFELQKFFVGGNFDRISECILAAYQFDVNSIKNNKDNNTSDLERNKRKNNRLIDRLIYNT